MKKTNKVIVLHEHARTGVLAGEISAIINEEAFDDLDGPIVRLTSLDTLRGRSGDKSAAGAAQGELFTEVYESGKS